MAELKDIDHSGGMISPDDLQLSEQHSKDRLTTQAEIAEGRVKEISHKDRSLTGSGAGGLDQFFEDFEHHTWTEEMPWELAKQVNGRVMGIVAQSSEEYQAGLTGSSAAILEGQLLKYTSDDVIGKIQDVRAGGIHSLQTLETLKGFTVKAMAEAEIQRADMVTKQSEAIENRSWWSRVGHKALTIGTLGAYALVKTEKRQKWYNSVLEKSMTKQFDRINKNIETLEARVGKQIAPMQSRIRRTLLAEPDPTEKANYRADLMKALRHTGAIGSIDLTRWGIANDAHQEKINFLEAAQGLDFVKKDLGVIGESKSKQLQQKQMIHSAQEQQKIMKGATKFEDVKNKLESDGMEASKEVPSLSGLVESITDDLDSHGVAVEKDIYNKDIKKSGLLTDSVRLIMLVKYIDTMSESSRRKKLQPKTGQSLVAWIKKQDDDTKGNIEIHDDTDVKTQLDILKNLGTGQIEKTAVVMRAAKGLDITNGSISALKGDIDTLTGALQTAYQIFLDKKGDDSFPDKDFELIQKIWEPVMESRKFLLEQVSKWEKEKEGYDKHAKDIDLSETTGKLTKLNERIDKLNEADTEPQSIAFLSKKHREMTGASTAKHNELSRQIQVLEAERSDKIKRKDALLEKQAPTFTNMGKVQELMDKLSVESGMDYEKRIKKAKSGATIGSMDQRIGQTLRVDSFSKELDVKFREQLEQNDQFEQLQNVSVGTKVKITYKETAATSFKFPDQLRGEKEYEFIVKSSNKKGVLLEREGGGMGRLAMTILGPAVKGGDIYKNAKVAKMSGGDYTDPSNPYVSGAWDSAIAYNYRIAA